MSSTDSRLRADRRGEFSLDRNVLPPGEAGARPNPLEGFPAPVARLVGWLPESMLRHAREVVSVASLLVVALVPGAAMAAGAISVASGTYCGFGSFCLFSGPDFDGDRVEYKRSDLFCQDKVPALDIRRALPGGARSVVNNTRTSGSGVEVKIYSAPGHLVLTSVKPGVEMRGLDEGVAQQMQYLCSYPGR
ncbi:MAG TPA: peptidase inhibitor family I36 protein [Pseudonocardia sp.]|nr:peptidase inhibitor family I36 protein [Pseudonocardia sp.]